MAAIDEVKEWIGWLKVLFSLLAAIVAALTGWLLNQLQEKNVQPEDMLNLERLNLLHAAAFVFIFYVSFPLMITVLRWSRYRKYMKYIRRVIFSLVIAIDLVLLFWLFSELESATGSSQLREWRKLDLYHGGALMVVMFLSILMLISMCEIGTKIRSLRPLKNE